MTSLEIREYGKICAYSEYLKAIEVCEARMKGKAYIKWQEKLNNLIDGRRSA